MLKYLRISLVLLGCVLLTGGAPQHPAQAQEQAPVTVEELEDLVAAIEDDAEREKLIGRLEALIEIKKTEGGAAEPAQQNLGTIVIEQISSQSEALGRQLSALADAILNAPEALAGLRTSLSDPQTLSRWTEGVLALAAVILAGFVTQAIVKKLLARPLSAIAWRESEGPVMRSALLATRLILILVPPLAFAAIGGLLVSLFSGDSIGRPVTVAVIYAVAIIGAVGAISRTLFAPAASGARPLRLSDETAHYLHIWIVRFSSVAVFGYFGIQIAGFFGLAGAAQSFLFKLIGLLLVLLLVMLIMQNRQSVARFVRGPEGARLRQVRRRLADIWHVLAILYVAIVYVVWAAGMPGGFAYISQATLLSALAVVLGIALASFASRLIDRAFSLSAQQTASFPGLEERVNRYLPIVKSVLQGVIAAVAVLAALQAWGVDILAWLSGQVGRALVSRLASIGAILLLAIVGWEALSTAIERYLASDDAAHSQRARTLLPLIRKVALAVLLVVVGLTLMSELGINIAPLLAGAGVVGLAVGFGAQKLVQDIITGLFILIEDTISVGDFVLLGGNDGTVEALSLRSIRLRDPAGTVHTIPFSDVTTVVNYSREFAFAVMEIGVAYKEDVDHVTRVIAEVGQELRSDPDQQTNILDDLQVLGLDRFDDSAIVIKVRIKTAPGMQWAVRRAYNRLLKRRFDAENIEIPFPQRTVWFAEGSEAPAPDGAGKDRLGGSQPNRSDEPAEGDMEGES